MKLKWIFKLLAVQVLCLVTPYLCAQVTIGSGIEPVNGALLDLKETDKPDGTANATKGLLLPRVILTNPTDITVGDIAGVTATNKDAHIGLTVYNLGQCDGKFAKGVYTWTGTKWIQLTRNPVLTSNPVLTFTPALPSGSLIEIPSGQDLRTAWTPAYAPSIAFTGTNQVEGAWTNTIGGGLTFNANPLTPVFPTTWTTSPINNISVWPDAMTAADLTSNPFLTRESKLTIQAIANTTGPCPPGTDQIQDITLNQTNYAIVPGSIANPTSLLILRNTSQQSLNILSNTKWQATASTGTANWEDILSSYTTAETGGERHDGSYNSNTFNYTSINPVVQGEKYETAQITFSDTENRAKPVTVTVLQCQGTENMNLVTTNATPDETAGANTWGTVVVRHQAKPNSSDPSKNIYEEFYSADFGPAGRWMTTNLIAWAYDSNITGVTLPVAPSVTPSLTDPNWCYPNGGSDGSTSTSFDDDKSLGLLYNWPAATGHQNSSTAQQGQVPGATPGANEVETLAPIGHYQGICPNGWHVPSDREWNQLEKEIYNNPLPYSNYTASDIPFTSTYNAGVGLGSDGTAQPGWRAEWESGTTSNNAPTAIGGYGTRGRTPMTLASGDGNIGHGLALIELCGKGVTTSNGRSNALTRGGFNSYPAGRYNESGVIQSYPTRAYYASSSTYSNNSAWYRYLDSGSNWVARGVVNNPSLISVRCKKDQ
jgi:uncharacterized protein (TIGR02145 family)